MKTLEVVVSFMAYCRLRRLSPKTVRGYDQHTKKLIELSPKFPPKPDVIQNFLATLSPYSADAFYRTFRAADNYAHKRFKTKNFMKSVTRPRVPKQIMPTISQSQLITLAWRLETASPRNRAIIATLIDTGIRVGELCNLKRKDILQFEDRIIIHGKTGYRVAPISAISREFLLALPEHPDGYLLYGTGKYKNTPLGETGVYKIVRRYLIRAGYEETKQFGGQVLRRSFGRFWLLDGGDMKSLSQTLGHASIATTDKYYTPLLTEDVIEIHHKHTPGRVFENAPKQ